MQKIIAIIFLTIFSAIQYGKLISYWNCKITNTSDTRAVQCDCEKILTDTNGDEDATILSLIHVKDKTEEWFNFHKYLPVPENYFRLSTKKTSRVLSFPSVGFPGDPFQPPKFS